LFLNMEKNDRLLSQLIECVRMVKEL